MNKYLLLGIFTFIVVAAIFFIMTSSTSTPQKMKLVMPKDTSENNKISKNAITALLISSENIYCYDSSMERGKHYSLKGDNSFRNFIIDKKKEKLNNLEIIIKPMASSNYKATVEILDEMKVNDIKKFALMDPTKKEQIFIDELKRH